MKSLILSFLLCLVSYFGIAQTENVGNFPTPVRTVHYETGTTPSGSVQIWTTRGRYFFGVYTDTFYLDKQKALNEVPSYKLLHIKADGNVSAWIPDYIRAADTVNKWMPKSTFIPAAQVNSDWSAVSGVAQILNKPTIYSFSGSTAQYTRGDGTYATFPTGVSSFSNDAGYLTSSSLTPYLLSSTAASTYYLQSNPSGYITSSAITGKLNISDTSTMLSPYIRSNVASSLFYPLTGNPSGFLTNASIANKVNYADTAAMLAPYMRSNIANSSYYPLVANPAGYLTLGDIANKVNYSDTAALVAPYLRSNVAAATYYLASNPAGYITNASIAGKLNISDTSAMLNPYLRSNIATASFYPLSSNPSGYLTSASIAGKLNISDTAVMLAPYLRVNTAAATYATIPNLALKVNISDTATMLSPYLRANVGAATYATIANLALKVNISDTSAMLANYARTNLVNTKENAIAAGTTSQYWRGDKTWQTLDKTAVGLANVDNTSDANKPVSTATQTALNLKQNALSGTGFVKISGTTISYDNSTYLTSVDTTNIASFSAKVRSLFSAGTGLSYNQASGQFVNTLATPTFNNAVSRSLSNAAGSTNQYTISTTQRANVYYTITLSVSTPLLAGSAAAEVFLEYSTNAGSSWNTVSSISNTQSVGLAVSVSISIPQNLILSGEIPANALVRLRTVTSGSTPGTATYVRGQEVLY
jgi:hypothetical protein